MIYINDKLVDKKEPKLWKEFQSEFSGHLDTLTKSKIVKPITIKYIPSLITKDPNPENKGKTQKPRSLSINHVSQIQIEDSMVDVRYTKTAPKKNAAGLPEYSGIQSTDVYTQLGVTDIDFAFFFWAYSLQNNRLNPDAKMMIENKEQEARDIATVKRNAATIQARLWNTIEDGGCTDELLASFAETRKHIYNVGTLDENQLRMAIEQDLELDRTQRSKLEFLEFTEPKKVTATEFVEKTDVVAEALEYDVITQLSAKQTFNWKTEEGETGEPIWSWEGTDKKDKPAYKFSLFLDENPDIRKAIVAKTDEKKVLTA